MKYDEQQRILQLLLEGLANNESADVGGIRKAPVSDLTCPDLLERETETFFRQTPLPIAMSTDLAEPDSYLATSEAGVPLLLTRDREGRVQAFLNVCRHRGVQVVEDGRGKRSRFTCPFHAWSYANTGDLIAVNREPKFGTIDKHDYGLTRVPVVESRGMIWVRPSPGVADFDVDELLGGLADEFTSWDFPSHAFHSAQVIDADINWKLAIDTFGENYHFDVLHRDTLASDIHGNLQTSDAYGRNYRMYFANKPGFQYVRERQMPVAEWPFRWITLGVYFLYPNTILLLDPAGLDLLRMYPVDGDPGKSRTYHSYYRSPELAARIASGEIQEEESRFTGFNRIVVEEDYATAASVQANAASGAQTHFTFGRNEPALHHYHNAHRDGLGLPALELIDA